MRIASLLLIAGLTLFGCVGDHGPSFFISGNVAPSMSCTLSPGNPLVAVGTYNVATHGGPYVFFPLFNNQLFENSSAAPPRPDPNGVIVQGAEIEIRNAAGGAISFPDLPNPFAISAATYVPSSDGPGSEPGQAVGALAIIPEQYADVLDDMLGSPDARLRILVSVQPYGETTGHTSIDGLEFVWPIDICSGLCNFELLAPDDEAGVCCAPGQDFLCAI